MQVLRSQEKIFGSLIKIKSHLVSSTIDLRLRKLRFKPSKFQDRNVRDLVDNSGEGTEDKDSVTGTIATLVDIVGIEAPTEVVGLSRLTSLTDL